MYFIRYAPWLYSILGSLSCICPVYNFYAIVAILIDLYSQKSANISLFQLVVTFIETYIFVPSFSISNLFMSIIKVFCCLLLLGKLFTLNIQHSKICNQHHIDTIIDQVTSFSCFISGHTQLQCVPITTREGALSSIFQVKRMSAFV